MLHQISKRNCKNLGLAGSCLKTQEILVKVTGVMMKLGRLCVSQLILILLKMKSVTIRDRDTMGQTRIKISKLAEHLKNLILK